MTDSPIASIQGEQMPPKKEQIYLAFGGPNAKVPVEQIATRGSTQRFVLLARATEDKEATRADGEERHTRKFMVLEVQEFGEITEPEDEDDDPSLFDDASEG